MQEGHATAVVECRDGNAAAQGLVAGRPKNPKAPQPTSDVGSGDTVLVGQPVAEAAVCEPDLEAFDGVPDHTVTLEKVERGHRTQKGIVVVAHDLAEQLGVVAAVVERVGQLLRGRPFDELAAVVHDGVVGSK